MDFKLINDINGLLGFVSDLDSDRDFLISNAERGTKIGTDEFSEIDNNVDGQLSLSELMATVNVKAGTTIFSSNDLIRAKLCQLAIPALIQQGFTPQEVWRLIDKIVQHSGWDAKDMIHNLSSTAEGLKKQGVPRDKLYSTMLVTIELELPVDLAHVVVELNNLGLEETEIAKLIKPFIDAYGVGAPELIVKLPDIMTALLEIRKDKKWIMEQVLKVQKELGVIAGFALDSIFLMLPQFYKAGLDTDDAIDTIKYMDSSFDVKTEEKRFIYDLLLRMLTAGFDIGTIKRLFDITRKYTIQVGYYSVATYLHKALERWSPEYLKKHFVDNWHEKGLAFLIDAGRRVSDIWFDFIGILDIDIGKTTDLKGMAAEIETAFGERIRLWEGKDPNAFEAKYMQLAVLINGLHDWEGEKYRSDSLRKAIVENIPTDVVYKLFALGGSSLYTSTFLKLFDKFMRSPDHLEQIKSGNYPRTYIVGFLNTLLKFDRLKDLISEDPEFFGNVVVREYFEEVCKAEKDIERMSYLTNIFHAVFNDKELFAFKPYFEKMMLDLYQKYKEEGNIFALACAAYFIKMNHRGFSEGNRVIADDIARNLPETFAPTIPDGWLKNGGLSSKLYFYQRDHFNLIQASYKRKGFAIRKIDSDTAVLSKKTGKIMLEVTVTLSNSDVIATLESEMDIVGHRGHSYQLRSTFHAFAYQENPQLLYLGSCGSYGDVAGLQEIMPGRYFMADKDTGEGRVNNDALYYLMEAIALGKKDWPDVRKYVHSKIGDKGLVYPDDPVFLMRDFIDRFEKWHVPAQM